MKLLPYIIENFSGGLSDEGKRGIPGAFKNGFNLNIHKKKKNTISANQKLKKISSSVVVDLIIKIVPVNSTTSYAFGDAGNVYKIVNDTVSKIYTDSNGAILSAGFFYGYLYWTTATKLGRCIETSADWSIDAVPNYQTLNNTTYHQIFIVPKSDLMCIGNQRYVATLSSAGVFNNQALDLFYGWEVRTLTLKKPKLLIGAKNSQQAELFTWDLSSASYEPVEGWQEKDIDAFLKGLGATYIFTPEMLYWFSGGNLSQAKELPTQVGLGAIDLWNSKMLFGCANGVYSYASRNKNYPVVLNLEYTPSPITIANYDTKSITIGAVLGNGNNLYVSWKDGTGYGLDNIDTANKAEAVYESLEFSGGIDNDKLFRIIKIITEALPTGSSVKIFYKVNGGSWTLASRQDGADLFNTAGGTKSIHSLEGQGEIFEIRIEIYPTANNSPEIKSINTYFEIMGNN